MMTDEIVTSDLAKFGYREKRLAADLLAAYVDSPDVLGDGVTVAMNMQSGYVFLTDEDFDTAMMNGTKLERWHNCPECGEEGFAEGLDDYDPESSDYPQHRVVDNAVHHLNGPEGFCDVCGEHCWTLRDEAE